MKRIFGIVAAFITLASPADATQAPALIWNTEAMNRAIEQTNFVVERGCSGTLISVAEKLILTNYHCIDSHVTSFEREITNSDGWVRKIKQRRYKDVAVEQHSYEGYTRVGTASYVAEIVAEDVRRDLAILKVKGRTPHVYASPILPEGDIVVRGSRAWAVGNPAGAESTVTEGIISNVNRTFEFPWTLGEKLPMIQFSGGIYGGNSGGALYNSRGYLIGVPAAGHSQATFIGLVIPAEIVRVFMRDNCLASVFDDTSDDAACKAKKAKKDTKAEKAE